MLSKIHTSSTNNFFFRTVQTLWYMHCSMVTYYYRISTITCNIKEFFLKWYTLKIFFFSQIHACLCKVTRNSCVCCSHLWRELQQQSLNSCTVIHSLCTISVLLNALFKAFFFVFSHFHFSTTIQSVAKNLNAINKMESPMSICCVTVVL